MPNATSLHDLKTLVLSRHPVIVIETVEEQRAVSILRSTARSVQLPFFEWTITNGLTNVAHRVGIPETADPTKLLRHLETIEESGIFLLKDFSPHLESVALTRLFRDVAQKFASKHATIVLTGAVIDLPEDIKHKVAYYELRLPERDELRGVVDSVVRSLDRRDRIHFQMKSGEMEELLQALAGLTLNQARQIVAYCALEDGKLSPQDIRMVHDRKAQMIKEGGLLEYFPAEDNRYSLGGFAKLKDWLQRARIGFSAEARALNLAPPRGILIVGVQGCGKSLAAKVIAREWKLPLIKLDAGRLFDKYVGESEKNFRRAVALAESMSPVVLWIDEIEKGMAPTGSSEADAGLSRRLFGAFLTWLQEKRHQVFVVATANDLSLLPPELLRKGRFDEIFFVDLPGPAERAEILRIHLELRKQAPAKFDLAALVATSDGYSGAEIEQAVISALYHALYLKRPLDTELLRKELQAMIPLSVSRKEDLQHLRQVARGRFAGVS